MVYCCVASVTVTHFNEHGVNTVHVGNLFDEASMPKFTYADSSNKFKTHIASLYPTCLSEANCTALHSILPCTDMDEAKLTETLDCILSKSPQGVSQVSNCQ